MSDFGITPSGKIMIGDGVGISPSGQIGIEIGDSSVFVPITSDPEEDRRKREDEDRERKERERREVQ